MTKAATMTLADFLMARLAEDEAVAQGPPNTTVIGNGGWYFDQTLQRWAIEPHTCDEYASPLLQIDPARVLADVAAKRRIVEWHEERDDCCELRYGDMQFDADPEVSVGTDARGELTVRRSIGFEPFIGCVTLMHLAAPYSDHPDFREEWRA